MFHQNNLFFKGDEAIMSGSFFSVCECSELMMVSFYSLFLFSSRNA